MSEELRETVEILRIGSEYAIQLAGITKEALQALFAIGNSFYMGRSGRVDFKNVLKNCAQKGTSPVPLAFPSEDETILSKAEAMLKGMNVQFARLPDFIQGDDETQYVVSSDQAHFFQVIAKRLFEDELKQIQRRGGNTEELPIKKDNCRMIEDNEYMQCVPKEYLEQAKQESIENLTKEKAAEEPSFRGSATSDMQEETKKKFLMSNREEQTRADPNYVRISIDKSSLLKDENDEYISFRILGTNGKEYTKIRTGDLIRSDVQSYTFAIHKKERFSIYDVGGNYVKQYPAETFLKFFSEPKEARYPRRNDPSQNKKIQRPAQKRTSGGRR